MNNLTEDQKETLKKVARATTPIDDLLHELLAIITELDSDLNKALNRVSDLESER